MANGKSKAKVRLVKDEPATEAPLTIEKPTGGSGLDKFKSKRTPTIAGVENLQTALPHHNIAAARDFVRLHPDEENYWSPELCFVSVPIKGQKKDLLHLIDEDIALAHLHSGKVQRFRLALATKPFDIFFLCHVPTRNEDNPWNASALKVCEKAKSLWVEATSRKAEGVDEYKGGAAKDKDAFPAPKWPAQPLDVLILAAFAGRIIDCEDHPALRRLIGAKQSVS